MKIMDMNSSITSPPQQPSSESLTTLLVQGLQSRDKQMLETVFSNTDDKVMRNTLKKLPIDCISMFLSELQSSLLNKSENSLVYIKWLEQLLSLRLPFIMTLPNIEEEFAPLIDLLNSRTRILDRIYRLKGRLNLMFSQIHTLNTTAGLTRERPQIDYESSTSDESEDDHFIDERMIGLNDENSDDSQMITEDDKEDEEHQSSDESSLDEDNLMSEDNDEESPKVNGISGTSETD